MAGNKMKPTEIIDVLAECGIKQSWIAEQLGTSRASFNDARTYHNFSPQRAEMLRKILLKVQKKVATVISSLENS